MLIIKQGSSHHLKQTNQKHKEKNKKLEVLKGIFYFTIKPNSYKYLYIKYHNITTFGFL